MKEKKIVVQYFTEVEIPSVPNFLRSPDGRAAIAIDEFSREQLEEIGRQWTEALIKKAKKRKR